MKVFKTFQYSPSHFISSVKAESSLNNASKFDEELQRCWSKARDDGHFRYRLDKLETQIIPGKYKFVSQLNVKRAVERRKPEFISSIAEAFNPDKFNFTKIKDDEVLFKLKNVSDDDRNENDEDVLAINISPLEYCNSLLISSIALCWPQVLQEKGLKSALSMMRLSATSAFKIGFNSLGAYASVNHHHFHVYYLQHNLFIETAKVEKLAGSCYELKDYPAPAFVFELKDGDMESVVSSVMKLGNYCLENAISHNVFITRGASFDTESCPSETYDAIRIYFWARKAAYGAKNDFVFNPAVCELAGHLPIKVESMFGTMTEDDVCQILSEVCVETFSKIRAEVVKLFS